MNSLSRTALASAEGAALGGGTGSSSKQSPPPYAQPANVDATFFFGFTALADLSYTPTTSSSNTEFTAPDFPFNSKANARYAAGSLLF